MNSKNRMLRRCVAAAVVAAFTAFAGVSGAASAGSHSSRQAATATVTLKLLQPAAADVAQQTITCTLSIDNPHKSTHVPTTVNVVAHWACTAPVASLSLSVKLYRGVVQVGSGNSSNAGQAALNGNAAANCVNGQYLGTATGTVVFPPGYTPQSSTRSVQSPVVSITC